MVEQGWNDAPWKVLLVDDDPAAHDMIGLALDDLKYSGRELQIINVHNLAEARTAMREEDDIALVLIDVILDGKPAGLEFAQWIRQDLYNQFVRLILITNYTDTVSEKSVVNRYDVNLFLDKRDIASERLFGGVVTAIRSFEELMRLYNNRKPLAEVIHASGRLFSQRRLSDMLHHITNQLAQLTVKACNVTINDVHVECLLREENGRSQQIATAGHRELDRNTDYHIDRQRRIDYCFEEQRNSYTAGHICAYVDSWSGEHFVFYIEAALPLQVLWNPLELYWQNVKIAMQQESITQDLAPQNSAANDSGLASSL